MNEQEILSKITFIKLVQPNYNGDGLELKQGDIALVSNEKCYQVMHDFPEKFKKIEIKDIPTDTFKHIYDNREKLIEKIDGQLIYEEKLYELLIENSSKLKDYSNMAILQKEKLPSSIVSSKDPSEKSRNVFVIHGRNEKARKALFQFLRAIGLEPLEWSKLIAGTGKSSPYIGEILESAFKTEPTVIVLMTGDDLANIRDIYLEKNEKPETPTPQARANVLFEAGMAFGRNPDKTIIIELGKTRKYSDIEGRHVIRIDNTPEKRSDLVERLKRAGCPIKTEGKNDWYKEGDFDAALPPEYSPDEENPDMVSNEIEEIEEEGIAIPTRIHVPMASNLSEDKEKILIYLNDHRNTEISERDISIFLGVDEGRVIHYLNQLMESEYIEFDYSLEGIRLSLIDNKGLAYLVEHKFI